MNTAVFPPINTLFADLWVAMCYYRFSQQSISFINQFLAPRRPGRENSLVFVGDAAWFIKLRRGNLQNLTT